MSITIPEGWKTSPFGPIPIDWEVKRIRDFGKVATGNTPSTDDKLNYGSEYLFISPFDLSYSKYIINSEKKLSKKGFDLSRKYPSGAVLFTCIGSTIGKLGIATIPLTSNQQINAITCDDFHSNEFLYYELSRMAHQIRLIAGEQAVPIINKSQFENIKILCPPFIEQKAIAQTLSIMDEVIENIKKIISKKELQKKALMQQLLTGKKRLKGYEGEWNFKRIDTVAKEVSIKNRDDNEIIVLSCTKYDGLVPSLEYFGRKIYSDDLTTYKIVPINHFAYATNHIEEGSIGHQDIYEEALISPMYTVFKTNDIINDAFLFRLLKSHNYIHEYQKRMEGSIDRRGGLRWNEFSKIKIPVPSLEEQAAISQVLQTADKEIQLLKLKADKLKEQKKGMMQVLLTGKKRLKIV